MRAFLRSSVRFIGKVAVRSMAGILLWISDVTDLYAKLIKPYLPAEWAAWLQQYAELLNVLTPFVVFGIIFLAILYTYYEVEKQVTRDPEIPSKLREFYVRSAQFTLYDLKGESEFPDWKRRANQWHNDVQDWIRQNMSEAALVRFQDRPMRTMGNMHVKNSAAVNDDHDQLVRAVKLGRENLKDLIENEAWDAKDRRERKWLRANIFRSKKRAVREK